MNAIAASTDASTTLSGIAIFANHPGTFVRSTKARLRHCPVEFLNSEPLRFSSVLQQDHQLSLQRAMIGDRTSPKSCDEFFRDFFYR